MVAVVESAVEDCVVMVMWGLESVVCVETGGLEYTEEEENEAEDVWEANE